MKIKILAALFGLSLIGNLFLSIFFGQIDKSSYTDWISALCNIIMASATVCAVLTARNYLAQFTAQEGYKIAISLINDDIMRIPSFIRARDTYKDMYKAIERTDNTFPKTENFIPLVDILAKAKKIGTSLDVFLSEISSKLQKLETYSLSMHKEREQDFNLCMMKLQLLSNEITSTIEHINSISFRMTDLYERNIRDNSYYDRGEHSGCTRFNLIASDKALLLRSSSVEILWSEISNHYDDFMSKSCSVTKVFTVDS